GGCLHLVSSLPSISPGVFDAVDVSAAPSSPQGSITATAKFTYYLRFRRILKHQFCSCN
ncbi:hypothetical protein LINPERHAP1_LOCUS11647, partial [Linum perenne]